MLTYESIVIDVLSNCHWLQYLTVPLYLRQSAWEPSQRTLLDTRPAADDARLARNTRVVAEALTRFMFELPAGSEGAAPSAVLSDEMVRCRAVM